jgi:hypothetical protein
MAAKTKMTAWNVYRGTKLVDTIYYDSKMAQEEVKTSIMDHDGYPPDIRIEKKE